MINIPRLLPLVRKEFPKAPLAKILAAMRQFAEAHPNLTDEQAAQAFQLGLQKARQPKARFAGIMNQIPTGVPSGPIR